MKHKRLYLLILFSLQVAFCSAHDFKIGLFELRPVANGVSVYVRFDRLDILKALQSDCADYNHLDQCFETYINKHVSFVFDGRQSRIRYESHEFGDDVIEVNLHIDVQPGTVSKIEIFNDCLLEFDDSQQNIVYLHFNDTKRGFRMDKDRIRTNAEY